MTGYRNRAGRRSGGNRPTRILIGTPAHPKPMLSIQCFEGRHADCHGDCKPFLPDRCGCSCHRSPAPQ